MATNCNTITMKSEDTGAIPVIVLIIFGPWILAQLWYIHFKRIILPRKGLPVISKIHDGIYLGGFPAFVKFDASWASARPPFESVLDLTCELPSIHRFGNYLNIPTWDGTAANKPVLIHCCYGIGRSATVACAVLIKCGHEAKSHWLLIRCKH
ncbi:hypothetical protein Pelo_7463 [Pelomyxa schiedti]|nr:hypothetical protein Pelo_7463 [Pelomyxa schiedti]